LADVLKPFTDDISGEPVTVIVNRKRVMRSAMTAIKDPRFCFLSPVMVDFSGEDAQDEGGPCREFLR